MKGKVLLFSDGSQRSLAAAVYAAGLIKGHPGMELTVASFLAGVPRGPFGLTRDEELASAKALADICRQIVQTTKKVFDDRRIKVETVAGVLETGSLPAGIGKLAREGNYNLVIMGAGSSTGLKGWAERSLAHAVARAAPCSVLLVKESPAELPECAGPTGPEAVVTGTSPAF